MAVGLLILIGLAVVYILPTLVAIWRRHPSAGSITAVNILLGWTLLGWVAALAWALTYVAPVEDRLIVRAPNRNPPPEKPRAEPAPTIGERTYPSFVAGLSHPDPTTGVIRADYARGLVREDDELIAQREPDNPHDPKAVLLRHQDFGLGYVPRRHNWIADAIDEGKKVRVFVTSIDDSDPSSVYISTDVVVNDW